MLAVHLMWIWLSSRELLLDPRATFRAILQRMETSARMKPVLKLFGFRDFRDLGPMFIAAEE
jgi:hypothetical protein